MLRSRGDGSFSAESVALRDRENRYKMSSVEIFSSPYQPFSCFVDRRLLEFLVFAMLMVHLKFFFSNGFLLRVSSRLWGGSLCDDPNNGCETNGY